MNSVELPSNSKRTGAVPKVPSAKDRDRKFQLRENCGTHKEGGRVQADRIEWLTPDEVAALWGVATATVRRAVHSGHLPAKIINQRVWRITRTDAASAYAMMSTSPTSLNGKSSVKRSA